MGTLLYCKCRVNAIVMSSVFCTGGLEMYLTLQTFGFLFIPQSFYTECKLQKL